MQNRNMQIVAVLVNSWWTWEAELPFCCVRWQVSGSKSSWKQWFFVCDIWTSLWYLIDGKSFYFSYAIQPLLYNDQSFRFFMDPSFWKQYEKRVNNIHYKIPQWKMKNHHRRCCIITEARKYVINKIRYKKSLTLKYTRNLSNFNHPFFSLKDLFFLVSCI